MATNIGEAAEEVAKELGLTKEEVLAEEYVLEYSAEDDKEEFTTWYDAEGNELPAGTPIGYSKYINKQESPIIPYDGLTEEY